MKKKSKTLPDWCHLWYAYRSLRITDVEGESDHHVFSLDPSSVTADCWASFFPSSCWTCQRVTLLSFFFTFFNFIGLKGHLKQLASSPLTNHRWQLHAGTCRRCEKATLCGRTIISLSRWTVKSPEKVKALISPHVGFSQGIIRFGTALALADKVLFIVWKRSQRTPLSYNVLYHLCVLFCHSRHPNIYIVPPLIF